VFAKANYRYVKLKKTYIRNLDWNKFCNYQRLAEIIFYGHYLLIWSHYYASFTFYKLPSDT